MHGNPQQQRLLLALGPLGSLDSSLHFDSLVDFVHYLEYLTSNKNKFNEQKTDFDSPLLKKCHFNKSNLVVDKYVHCAIPDPQLEYIFESFDPPIYDYEAFLDPEFNFNHSICSNVEGDMINEIFSPNISGGHYNPYKRFQVCASGASRSCSMLLDLAGLEVVDLHTQKHPHVFLDLILSFPQIVDFYLINPDCRVLANHRHSKSGKVTSQLLVQQHNLIDRMNLCRSRFFDSLHAFFSVPEAHILGMSSSLHLWSSEAPILPNAHCHNLIPFFSYRKQSCSADPSVTEGFVDRFREAVGSLSYRACSSKPFSVSPPDKIPHSRVSICFKDSTISHRYIIDKDLYDSLRLDMSSFYGDLLSQTICPWVGDKFPVDIDRLRELWSDIVYSEFGDLMDCYQLLDIRISWIPYYQKHRLLRSLKYKCRPPVLDLDLFFKKCPGVVTYYDCVDTSVVVDFLNKQLEIAISCSDYSKICRYESMLRKAELIFDSHPDSSILDWLRFLSTWVTDTRVFGFWCNIRRYRLDPDHLIFVDYRVCSVCGHFVTPIGKVRYCIVDHIIISSRSGFGIYSLDKPPP